MLKNVKNIEFPYFIHQHWFVTMLATIACRYDTLSYIHKHYFVIRVQAPQCIAIPDMTLIWHTNRNGWGRVTQERESKCATGTRSITTLTHSRHFTLTTYPLMLPQYIFVNRTLKIVLTNLLNIQPQMELFGNVFVKTNDTYEKKYFYSLIKCQKFV